MRIHIIAHQYNGSYKTSCGETMYDPDFECGTTNRDESDCRDCLSVIYPGPAWKSNIKMNWDKIREIRSEYRKGVKGFGTKALAYKHGSSRTNIQAIVTNQTWKE